MSKNNSTTKNLVTSALLIAIGVLLPQLFHTFGQTAGQVFLPMHIPVIMAGLMVGPLWGMGVAVFIPVVSMLFLGMPQIPMLWFMIVELVAYAVFSGLLSEKINIYLNLAITMVFGRIVYGLSLIIAVKLFKMNFPFAQTAAFFTGMTKGLPGILIQLTIIPPIIYALKKGGFAFVKSK